jgi:putative FmdB family regulatory protein
MPTYEYKRQDGSVFEIIQGINDKPLEKCPDTGQPVKRIITGGGGVVYKGDGWYVTDYKNSDRKNGRKAASVEPDGKKDKSEKTDKTGKITENSSSKSEEKA